MNAVEIEQAISELVEAVFDPAEFPYAFLEAFGNKETTLKRLRTGNTNQSDVGGLLQRGNIHLWEEEGQEIVTKHGESSGNADVPVGSGKKKARRSS